MVWACCQSACGHGGMPGLADKVAFLCCPAAYGASDQAVEALETRMSWVFLTSDDAYKLKKPLREPLIDLRTVEHRRLNCVRELHLNRRLAPSIYLDVVPLTLAADGALSLGGEGEVVDWLVHMQRLPHEHMLDYALAHDCCERPPVRRAAGALARFFVSARAEQLSASVYWHRLERETVRRVRQLQAPPWSWHKAVLQQLLADQRRWLQQRRPLLERRAAERRIVEGHGDLRPQHVCLQPRPLFIDCLEFSRSLRVLDPLDDLAYLVLECERQGAAWVGECFVDVYVRATDDTDAVPLVPFYASRRAVLRAFQCLRHTLDAHDAEHPRWIDRAEGYLHLACELIGRAEAAP